jgi:glycolate oxidase FAD binding subunit
LGGESRGQATAIVVRVEGTEAEVDWLAELARRELTAGGGTAARRLDGHQAESLWARQVEFSDRGAGEVADQSPLVIKIAVPPGDVTKIVAALLAFDPQCTIQAHAGNGIIYARFTQFGHADVTSTLIGKLRPMAVQHGGSLVILLSKLDGLTPHLIWGGRSETTVLLERIKRKFDPHNILNPGRFVF